GIGGVAGLGGGFGSGALGGLGGSNGSIGLPNGVTAAQGAAGGSGMLGIAGTLGATGRTASVGGLPPALRPSAPFIAQTVAHPSSLAAALPGPDDGYAIIAGLENAGTDLVTRFADLPATVQEVLRELTSGRFG